MSEKYLYFVYDLYYPNGESDLVHVDDKVLTIKELKEKILKKNFERAIDKEYAIYQLEQADFILYLVLNIKTNELSKPVVLRKP